MSLLGCKVEVGGVCWAQVWIWDQATHPGLHSSANVGQGAVQPGEPCSLYQTPHAKESICLWGPSLPTHLHAPGGLSYSV